MTRPRGTRRRHAALAAAVVGTAVAVGLGGCGSGSTDPQGGGKVTPVDRTGKVTFPDLGYRKVAPRLPAHVSPGTVLVVDLTNTGSAQPSQMTLALGATAAGLHWSQWGTARATGHGTATVRVCTTSCGAGYDRSYPATITLSDIRACHGHRFYEQANVALSTAGLSALPHGVSSRWPATLKNPC